MDVGDQFALEHLLFSIRKCRVCGIEKDLLSDFYMTRKGRGAYPSSYSYECKQCTIDRIKTTRKKPKKSTECEYPDW
jgi:hypothetical protein